MKALLIKGWCFHDSGHGGRGSKSDHERRKGTAWTEEEHRLFLLGLDKYGKGDWRSISRNFVVSRTPTQVASHAQKYFIRLNSMNKDRRRSSIHDITRVESGKASTNRGPITGQGNCTEVGSTKVEKNPSQPSSAPEIGMESSTMTLLGGQPSAYRARLPASVGASVEEKAINLSSMMCCVFNAIVGHVLYIVEWNNAKMTVYHKFMKPCLFRFDYNYNKHTGLHVCYIFSLDFG
ncbi:hypothetical protein HPP92_022614 [Vanilla planifolia]|uniref:Uncharacterized protein n=1 Tax=Vanilla planifolia TaxID=51239 RepID=A0A835PTV0_VANPL|nr:hypothetical protein HPP92_022614 [Vanilla planifolia]